MKLFTTPLIGCVMIVGGAFSAGWAKAEDLAKPTQPSSPLSASAPAKTPADSVLTAAAAPSAVPPMSATSRVTDKRDGFLQAKGLQLGGEGNPGGAYIGWGSSVVTVPANDASWPKARVMAYELALRHAESNFLRFIQQHDEVSSVTSTFVDDSQINAEFAKEAATENDKWKVLENKALALTNIELDAKLKAAGVDPATVQGLPPHQKVDKLRQAIVDTSIRQACGSLAGVRTLQTFVGFDETGKYAVGVLIVQSPRFADLAEVLRSGQVAHTADRQPNIPIHQQLPDHINSGSLMDDFGVRVLVDEHGDQCIVSFGQWAVAGSDANARLAEIRDNNAEEEAVGIADDALTEFASASAGWAEQTTRSQEAAEFQRLYANGGIDDVSGAQFIDKSMQTMRVQAHLTISGVAEIATWRAKDPQYGREIIGVVRMWSPTSQKVAHDVKSHQLGGGTKEPKTTGGARQGHDFDKTNDF